MVMVLLKLAPEEEKNDDHDQDFLTKTLLHIWSWSSENTLSETLPKSCKVDTHWIVEARAHQDPPAMLVAPLTLACAALPDAPHRVALVDLYVKQVAEAKQPLSEFALELLP